MCFAKIDCSIICSRSAQVADNETMRHGIYLQHENSFYQHSILETHPSRSQNSAVPVRQKGIARVDQTETNGHVTVTLLAVLELLQELEVSWDDDGLPDCGSRGHVA